MESLPISLNNVELFDSLLHGKDGISVLRDAGDVVLVTKDIATEGNRAGCLLCFSVEVDGKLVRAQTVMTVRVLTLALEILNARYEDGKLRQTS